MTINDYLRIIRERWRSIVVATIVGVMCGVAVYSIAPTQYTASSSLYVSAQVGDNPQQAYQGAQLSEQRISSYTQLAISDRVLTQVASQLQLNLSPDELAERVNVTSNADSVIIGVDGRAASPQAAMDLTNAVDRVLIDLVTELERPAATNGVPPVELRLIEPAGQPAAPSSLGLTTLMLLGCITGLAAGILIATVRNLLDTSLKSAEQIEQATGVPSLGVIPFEREAGNSPLAILNNPSGPRAEAIRRLRTSVAFVAVDRPCKVIAITSARPGEGKSTTLANLAIALTSAGKRVVIIDADLRKPTIDGLFGLDRAVGLTTVLSGQAPLNRIVQTWGTDGLSICCSGPQPPNPSELLSSNQMARTIDSFRSSSDYVLIDTPPLLPVTDAAIIAALVDGTVVVSRQGVTTANELKEVLQELRKVSASIAGTILNMARGQSAPTYRYYGNRDSTPDVSPPSRPLEPSNEQSRPQSTLSEETRRIRRASVGQASERRRPPE